MRVDLEVAERVINRPHVIDLRDDGWTIMHPLACHPRLFACPVNRAAARDLKGVPKPSEMGEFFCDLRPNGRLRIGERAPESQGIDWAALVAELRAARGAQELVEQAIAKFERDLGFTAPELWPMRVQLLREAIEQAWEDDGRAGPEAEGDHRRHTR